MASSVQLTVVIGGGVAGCAAATAVARAGGTCVLVEARRNLGGVAVQGEHRSLCGLAPLDAAHPQLLEPELVGPWLELLSTGAPFRQGRVWLWPTSATRLQAGLTQGLRATGVDVRMGCQLQQVEHAQHITAVALRHPSGACERLACSQLIDASGGAVLADMLGLPRLPAQQWGSCRALLRLPGACDGRSQRVRLLGAMQRAINQQVALSLVPVGADHWQLSLDVAPGSPCREAQRVLELAAQAVQAELLAVTLQVAERDQGRPLGTVTLEQLFAERERGLCWAAWPREEHTANGVLWAYPTGDRHGVPPAAVTLASTPQGCWFIGKSMPVSSEAASALRVTGTCLALGAAVGQAAVRAQSLGQ